MVELECEIARVQVDLRFAIIEELKLAGVLDAQGNAHPNLRGETGSAGADGVSNIPGPKGNSGDSGADGRDGKSVSKEEAAELIRQTLDENPEKFRGLGGKDGVERKGATGLAGLDEEAIINLVVKAISDPSLLEHATVKLAYVEQWIATQIARTAPSDPVHRVVESLRQWIKQ